jgi:hypothetical protein
LHTQTIRGDDAFETKRTIRREAYRTLEYDERPIEKPYQKVIGPSLDQMITQIPDGRSRKLTAFCSNIRKILSIFGEECESYLFLYLQNKIIERAAESYYRLITQYNTS